MSYRFSVVASLFPCFMANGKFVVIMISLYGGFFGSDDDFEGSG